LDGGQVNSIITDKGKIKAPIVVNSAGAHSSAIGAMAGIELPASPQRYDFIVTEPLKRFLAPFVLSLSHGLQMAQSSRGELICCMRSPQERSRTDDMAASIESLQHITRVATGLMPQVRHLKAMRQWVGYADVSPDGMPVIGRVDGVGGFYQATGFGSLGIEVSTAAARLLAGEILDGQSSPALGVFAPDRLRS
jgi:sarcosine oxidase subunit beta